MPAASDDWRGAMAKLMAASSPSEEKSAMRTIAKVEGAVCHEMGCTDALRKMIFAYAGSVDLDLRRPALYALGNMCAVVDDLWPVHACQAALTDCVVHPDKDVRDLSIRCISRLAAIHGPSIWADGNMRSALIGGAKSGGSTLVRGRCLEALAALSSHEANWRSMWLEAGWVLSTAARERELAPFNRCNALRAIEAIAHDDNRRPMWHNPGVGSIIMGTSKGNFDEECLFYIYATLANLLTDLETATAAFTHGGAQSMIREGLHGARGPRVQEGALRVIVGLASAAFDQHYSCQVWKDVGATLIEMTCSSSSQLHAELAMEALANWSAHVESGHFPWNTNKASVWLFPHARRSEGERADEHRGHTRVMRTMALRILANSLGRGHNTRVISGSESIVAALLCDGAEDTHLAHGIRAHALRGLSNMARLNVRYHAVVETARRIMSSSSVEEGAPLASNGPLSFRYRQCRLGAIECAPRAARLSHRQCASRSTDASLQRACQACEGTLASLSALVDLVGHDQRAPNCCV